MLNFGTFNFNGVVMVDYKKDYANGWYVIVANPQEPTQYIGVRIEQDTDTIRFDVYIEDKTPLNICGNILKNPKTSRVLYITDNAKNIQPSM